MDRIVAVLLALARVAGVLGPLRLLRGRRAEKRKLLKVRKILGGIESEYRAFAAEKLEKEQE